MVDRRQAMSAASSRLINSGYDLDDRSIASSYAPYPHSKPYINDSYRASPTKPISAMPVSERSGVMSALKNLQSKIRNLEMERSAAETNLHTLSSETSKYKEALQRESSQKDSLQSQMSKHTQEVENQLMSAETRCNVLEKQLDYMRKMVDNAERQRTEALRVPEPAPRRPYSPHQGIEIKHQLDKISELEREHLKLTATQTLAENKIRDLEDKLREEKHHRKLMQEKTAELQTAAETNRILLEAGSPPPSRRTPSPRYVLAEKPPVKKKKKPLTRKSVPAKTKHVRVQPADHYHINLKDIPFVAGKATTPSHSVGGNVQQMFSMMKAHNPRLCSRMSAGAGDRKRYVPKSYATQRRGSASSTSTDSDLNDLLMNLQDEFGHMSFEHRELVKQIDDAEDYRLKEDLERELDHLVSRMEDKGAQIRKLRNHQDQLSKGKQKKKKPKVKRPNLIDNNGYRTSSTNGEVEVTTTIKTKGKRAHNINVSKPSQAVTRPSSARSGKLNLLKDVKQIQTTLRKDDVSWD